MRRARHHGVSDVVYNHFGPDGNFLPLYAPIFLSGCADAGARR